MGLADTLALMSRLPASHQDAFINRDVSKGWKPRALIFCAFGTAESLHWLSFLLSVSKTAKIAQARGLSRIGT